MNWFKKCQYELTHYEIGAKYSKSLTVQAWIIVIIYDKSIFCNWPPFISQTFYITDISISYLW